MRPEQRYDVVISFAGEDRQYAEALASELKRRNIVLFYDKYEKAALWGKDLYTHLSGIYQNQGQYCVMFLSQHYAKKVWTNHERQAAQARAFEENKEYILPVRLDDTEIPGILPTIGYLKWSEETPETIAEAILSKLEEAPQPRGLPSPEPQPATGKQSELDSNAVKIADESFLRILTGHTDAVTSVAFAPDGSTLASGSRDNTVRLWRVADGSLLRTLEGHMGDVESVALTPDGAALASGSEWDNTVRLWRVADGSLLRTLEGGVGGVALTPDGATLASVTLASGSLDKPVRLWRWPVRLWRVADESLLRTLEGHTNRVTSVAFAPDGATLASGSLDKTVWLWRVADGRLLRTLEGHTNGVWNRMFEAMFERWGLGEAVAFAPDGATLASGSWDKTVRLWRLWT